MDLAKLENIKVQSENAKIILDKLISKSATIGIVGLGYVGLPIALEFAKKGFKVLGVDVSKDKVDSLNKGINYIEDLKDEEIKEVVEKGLLATSIDYATLSEADVTFVCVPTPFNEAKDPDLSYIVGSAESIMPHMRKAQLYILKSTTFPGTTQDYFLPILEKSGLKVGEDFFCAFSPERVDPGNKVYHTGNTPVVVGGVGEESTALSAATNLQIIEQVYTVKNPKIAELEKLMENIFRSVNIALVNEIGLLCERLDGINVWEAIEAASTKPFGFMPFFPGPGVGGHCIPVDPYYLSWLARAYDFETRFITLAANVNEGMPYHIVKKVVQNVANQPVALKDAKILLVGVSFKKNVKDLRLSPAETIIRLLKMQGISKIDYVDSWVDRYAVDGVNVPKTEFDKNKVSEYNVVIFVTDHDDFDVDAIVENAQSIIDTRNMAKNVNEKYRDKISLVGSNENYWN